MDAALGRDRPTRVGLALSGGGDSMALLVLALAWAAPRGVTLAACSVDHGLRPEAGDEIALAARFCAAHGVAHDVFRCPPGSLQGNIQDAARRARYAFMAGWAGSRSLSHVALGHTGDDQAETVLLRLLRGSGVEGLSAMRPARADGAVTWIRPMLAMGRSELRDVLRARGVTWAEDPSNDDPVWTRVRLRQAMAALGLSRDGLCATAGRMARAADALSGHALCAASSIATTPAGAVRLDRSGLTALPMDTQLRLIASALCWVSGAAYRPRAAALEAAVRQVLGNSAPVMSPDTNQGTNQGTNKGTNQGTGRDTANAAATATLHGCVLRSVTGAVWIMREPAAAGPNVPADAVWDGRWRFLAGTGADRDPGSGGLTLGALGQAGLRNCGDWRALGVPRQALLTSPALWRGATLVSAPIAAPDPDGPQIVLVPGCDDFNATFKTH